MTVALSVLKGGMYLVCSFRNMHFHVLIDEHQFSLEESIWEVLDYESAALSYNIRQSIAD